MWEVEMETETGRNFRDWYEENADDMSVKRKKAYAKDPAARKAAQERARKYRKRIKDGERVTRTQHRTLNGKEVEVFSTGYVAAELGVSATMLINWEAKGWIPESVFGEKHRLYTVKQKKLIEKLYSVSKGRKAAAISKAIEKVHDNWT
jgi:hypothetical protein